MASISVKVTDLGDYLREQRQAARLSIRQLATLAGVSNPYLSQVERGLRKPSAEVLQQIAKGLRISAEALYVRAGILDSEGRPDVEAAIGADPALTDRQRRALLDIYASFKAEGHRPDLTSEAAAVADAPTPSRPTVRRAAANRTTKRATTPKRATTTKRASTTTRASTAKRTGGQRTRASSTTKPAPTKRSAPKRKTGSDES